jgi:hypothetical protein
MLLPQHFALSDWRNNNKRRHTGLEPLGNKKRKAELEREQL